MLISILSTLALAGDWSAELSQDAAALDQAALAEFMAAEPLQNRAGMPYFPMAYRPERATYLAWRLTHGDDPGEIRAALASQLSPAGRDNPELILGLIAQEEDALVRAALLSGLTRVDPELALPILERSLASEDTTERFEAATVLAKHADGALALAALETALTDAAPRVRKAAAFALGVHRVGDPAALRPLLSDDSSDVRLAALDALERIDPALWAQWSAELGLAGDPDLRVARAASRALVQQ
ncbi:MAG: HEAT repeat domain-containing protein [Myxococcota bacterium]|nr:HEAT repeat domain-containing protein [Myxococcota bacterium]